MDTNTLNPENVWGVVGVAICFIVLGVMIWKDRKREPLPKYNQPRKKSELHARDRYEVVELIEEDQNIFMN